MTTLAHLESTEIERIALIQPTSLGGIVQSLPLFPMLKERFPNSRITAVINAEQSELLDGHRNIDRCITYDRRRLVQQWRRVARTLRNGQFDLAIDLHGLLRTGAMIRVTAAPVRIGLETARECAGLAYTHTLPDTGPLVPDYVRFWRLAENLGLSERRQTWDVPVDSASTDWAEAQFARFNRPHLVVHPGAGWATTRWPIEKFAVVACKAVRQFRCSVTVIGNESERALSEQFTDLMRRFIPSRPVLNLCGKTNLKQLAAVLRRADFVVSNDSGPMHLAAAMGTQVVGVFTCTSPDVSGPPGPGHAFVSTTLPCHASYRKRCPKRGPGHLACLDELSTERVTEALHPLIRARIERRRVA